MGVTAVSQTPNEFRYGIAQQTALGTAVADAGAFVELDCEPTEVNYGVKQLDQPSSHGMRYKTDNDIITHQYGVMPSVTLSGIANHNSLDYFSYAFCQSVTEATATPYLKTFVVHASQPSFNSIASVSSEGQLLTFVLRDPEASKSVKLTDCIAKSITYTWSQGEPLKYSVELVSRSAVSFSSNPTGTWTKVTSGDFWYFEDLDTVTIDSTSFHLNSFELSLSQDVLPIGQDGSGNFADYGLVNKQLGFKVKVVKDADWEANLTAWTGNTAIDGDIKIGTGTADGDITFDFRGKLNAETGAQKVHDDLVHGEINGVLTHDGSSALPLTIGIANAVDRTWVSA